MDQSIWAIIYKLGLPTWRTSLFTPLPNAAAANSSFDVADKILPNQIGRVYGLSIYCDTTNPDGSPQITTTDATNLYLQLKSGAADFFDMVRLSELNFEFAGVPTPVGGSRFMNVNIPRFDLSTSKFINPTGIFSVATPPASIMLNLWYIDKITDKFLFDQGYMANQGHFAERKA